MKKLTEDQKQVIKNYFTKKYNLKEGIIDYIFGKVLVNKLKNDKNFISLAKDLEKRMDITKRIVQSAANKGEPVPSDISKIIRGEN